MGYVSEVALALTETGAKVMRQRLMSPAVSQEQRELVEELLSATDRHYKDSRSGSELWYWQWLKWYNDFLDVSFMESLLQDMNHEDYRFIRIGEDFEDTEILGGFWENPFGMDLSRQITFETEG